MAKLKLQRRSARTETAWKLVLSAGRFGFGWLGHSQVKVVIVRVHQPLLF